MLRETISLAWRMAQRTVTLDLRARGNASTSWRCTSWCAPSLTAATGHPGRAPRVSKLSNGGEWVERRMSLTAYADLFAAARPDCGCGAPVLRIERRWERTYEAWLPVDSKVCASGCREFVEPVEPPDPRD